MMFQRLAARHESAARLPGTFADNYPHGQIIHADRPTGAFAVKFATFSSLQKKSPRLQTWVTP